MERHITALPPTLISNIFLPKQDLASWMHDGIAGLQTVVLYSVPELQALTAFQSLTNMPGALMERCITVFASNPNPKS